MPNINKTFSIYGTELMKVVDKQEGVGGREEGIETRCEGTSWGDLGTGAWLVGDGEITRVVGGV